VRRAKVAHDRGRSVGFENVSDTILRLIPDEPNRVPSAAAREMAAGVLQRALLQADDVSDLVTRTVRFVDCGDNFETVRCPRCGADVGEWWTLAMEAAHDQQFADLRATTPCCGTTVSLNDLAYSWPAGFARYTLEVPNPGVGSLPKPIHQRLEQVLGGRLREIWAHY
jgi:hypothetical protein